MKRERKGKGQERLSFAESRGVLEGGWLVWFGLACWKEGWDERRGRDV